MPSRRPAADGGCRGDEGAAGRATKEKGVRGTGIDRGSSNSWCDPETRASCRDAPSDGDLLRTDKRHGLSDTRSRPAAPAETWSGCSLGPGRAPVQDRRTCARVPALRRTTTAPTTRSPRSPSAKTALLIWERADRTGGDRFDYSWCTRVALSARATRRDSTQTGDGVHRLRHRDRLSSSVTIADVRVVHVERRPARSRGIVQLGDRPRCGWPRTSRRRVPWSGPRGGHPPGEDRGAFADVLAEAGLPAPRTASPLLRRSPGLGDRIGDTVLVRPLDVVVAGGWNRQRVDPGVDIQRATEVSQPTGAGRRSWRRGGDHGDALFDGDDLTGRVMEQIEEAGCTPATRMRCPRQPGREVVDRIRTSPRRSPAASGPGPDQLQIALAAHSDHRGQPARSRTVPFVSRHGHPGWPRPPPGDARRRSRNAGRGNAAGQWRRVTETQRHDRGQGGVDAVHRFRTGRGSVDTSLGQMKSTGEGWGVDIGSAPHSPRARWRLGLCRPRATCSSRWPTGQRYVISRQALDDLRLRSWPAGTASMLAGPRVVTTVRKQQGSGPGEPPSE